MSRLLLTAMLLFSALLSPAQGQSALVLKSKPKDEVIRAVDTDHKGLIDLGDRWKSAGTGTVALVPTAAFRPGFVAVTDFIANVPHLDGALGRFNNQLTVSARLQSDVALTHCFILLEMDYLDADWANDARLRSTNVGRLLYARLPDLSAGQAVLFKEDFRLPGPLGEVDIRVHVFSHGEELLHSRLDPAYLQEQIRKTAALASGADSYPAIFRKGAPPKLPRDARPGPDETLLLELKISAAGEVVAAKPPSGGNAALTKAVISTVKSWRFDPAVSHGLPVASTLQFAVPLTAPRTSAP